MPISTHPSSTLGLSLLWQKNGRSRSICSFIRQKVAHPDHLKARDLNRDRTLMNADAEDTPSAMMPIKSAVRGASERKQLRQQLFGERLVEAAAGGEIVRPHHVSGDHADHGKREADRAAAA